MKTAKLYHDATYKPLLEKLGTAMPKPEVTAGAEGAYVTVTAGPKDPQKEGYVSTVHCCSFVLQSGSLASIALRLLVHEFFLWVK